MLSDSMRVRGWAAAGGLAGLLLGTRAADLALDFALVLTERFTQGSSAAFFWPLRGTT
jgi:hypothetical protein